RTRAEWPRRDKAQIVEAMGQALADIAGATVNFSQPIKDNVDEALAGVKGELSIKIFGPDVFTLDAKAKEVAAVLGQVAGVADLDYERLVGQPQLNIVVDPPAATPSPINIPHV